MKPGEEKKQDAGSSQKSRLGTETEKTGSGTKPHTKTRVGEDIADPPDTSQATKIGEDIADPPD